MRITSSLNAYFLPFLFGIYDNLTSDPVPGLQKYDMCMTEQVPGPQRVKIVGRHIASAPYHLDLKLNLNQITFTVVCCNDDGHRERSKKREVLWKCLQVRVNMIRWEELWDICEASDIKLNKHKKWGIFC